jgi:hypothetical protein
VRRALFKADGNVTKAANALKVNSVDLRRLTWSKPALIALALEQAHRVADRAEENLVRELNGDNPHRALAASTFVLSHYRAARTRGWGRRSTDGDDDPPPQATMVRVIWAGDAGGYHPPLPAAPEARRDADADGLEDGRRH